MTRRGPKDGHGTRTALSPGAVNADGDDPRLGGPPSRSQPSAADPGPVVIGAGAVPQRAVGIRNSAYLIEGHLYLPGRGAIRAAYAVADQWGWAVMARRGKQIVTVERADHRVPASARAAAVEMVHRLTAGWQAPTAAPVIPKFPARCVSEGWRTGPGQDIGPLASKEKYAMSEPHNTVEESTEDAAAPLADDAGEAAAATDVSEEDADGDEGDE